MGPISGGYIWKIDRADPDAGGLRRRRDDACNGFTPRARTAGRPARTRRPRREQQQWVANYFNEFTTTLRTPDINDPNGYSKYIDPVNWVDHHMLNVFMMNVDALPLERLLLQGPRWPRRIRSRLGLRPFGRIERRPRRRSVPLARSDGRSGHRLLRHSGTGRAGSGGATCSRTPASGSCTSTAGRCGATTS